MRFTDFKAGERNQFINKMNRLGLNVEKFDNKKVQNYYSTFDKEADPDDLKYPPRPELDGFSREPIVLKDLDTNNLYHLRLRPSAFFQTNYYDELVEDKENFPFIQNKSGIWQVDTTDSFHNQYLGFNLELIEKGRNYDETGVEISQEKAKMTSEFEAFDDFGKDPTNYNDVYAQDPTVSVAKPIFDISSLVESQIEKAEKLLDESILNLKDLLEAKEKGQLESAMWSVEEVDKLYNSNISTDDKRAFLIWLQNKNGKKLKGEFAEMYGSDYPTPPNVVIELMRKGKLFFVEDAPYTERLQPKVIYLSGNIWTKWASLQDGSDKQKNFVSLWGEDILNTHRKVLEPLWKETWEKRLRFKGLKEMRITMLPTTDMAQNVVIETYISPKETKAQQRNFEIYQSMKKGEMVEDLSRVKAYETQKSNNYVVKKKVPLVTAFLLWLKEAGTGDNGAKNGVQWSKTTQSYEDVRDKFIKPIDNPYASDKKAGKDKWAREKDDAKKVGTRLFSEFLDKGLLASDTTKLEAIWNSTFNYYVDPVLEQVPIGFTYKKYLDNIFLFSLREANLKALRYYLTRGSVGLAYGVGIGKTFCSIMVMKQGLDLGLTNRALVIVPNQVYFQFGEEITRGLGTDFNPMAENTRLNLFYNGGGLYNAKGNNAVDGINLCTYEATQKFQFIKEKLYEEIDGEIQPTADWLIRASKIQFQGGLDNNNMQLVKDELNNSSGVLFNEIVTDSSEDEEEDETIDISEEKEMGGEIFDEGGKTKDIEPIYINSDSVDWDMVVVDEAHNFNAFFSGVKAKAKSEQTDSTRTNREENPYSSIRETAGKAGSTQAKQLFWLSQYIQSKSNIKNTILLSATPFTNSPVQVFSLLTFLDYDALVETKVEIMKDFYDLFAKIEYAEDFKTDLRIVKRLKLTGWVNIIAMQKLIYRLFDKSSPEEEERAVIRPKKIVIPLKRLEVDKKVINLAKENHVSTTIKMSTDQEMLWDKVRQYAQTPKMKYEDICNERTINETKLGKYTKPKKPKKDDEDTDVENANDLADGSKDGEKSKREAKALQCLGWGRQICLNPYLFKCSGYKEDPSGREYVEASPKLLYTTECIKSVKDYHDAEGSVVSGQIIYMNYGVEAFPLIREYLVEEIGFNLNEIGIISGKGNYVGKKRYNNKLDVQDFFLGRKKNVETGEYDNLEDSKRVKVLLGSEAIKEGINLQDYASVLYNCFLDFNPTDQVQVEGRIWRQGNAFANVRIVIPLIADCIDIFMFQKLADKTERINQLWTRAGNKNELDTTSFNPDELKYELMTDPEAIATLERENINSRLDDDIVEESEVYSGYRNLLSIFSKRDKILDKGFEEIGENLILYHKINQFRPDLIESPFFNIKGIMDYINKLGALGVKKDPKIPFRDVDIDVIKNFAETVKTNNFEKLDIDEFRRNFARIVDDSSTYLSRCGIEDVQSHPLYIKYINNPTQLDTLNTLVNYSTEDIIELMVKVNKEQKVGYPLNYSANWREAYNKTRELPILEFDEVTYKTKKGTKKGIATFVVIEGEKSLDYFTSQFAEFFEDDKISDFMRKALKESGTKITEKEFKEDDFHSGGSQDSYITEGVANELKKFIVYYLRNAPDDYNFYNKNGTLSPRVFSLDIGELEDINVEDKEVKRVNTQKASKNPKPTKYPDSFKFDYKTSGNKLKDGEQFLKALYTETIDVEDAEWNYITFDDNDDLMSIYLHQAMAYSEDGDKMPLVAGEVGSYYEDFPVYWQSLLSGFSGSRLSFIENNEIKWIQVQETFTSAYGFYKDGSDEVVYKNEFPKVLADFNIAFRDKLEPFGLLTKNDVSEKVTESQVKINSIKLEQKNLFEEERFIELVQEVRRKQQELAKEEIRAGNSFRARANTFAKPNPEYLGNEYLDLFETRGKAKGQRFEEAVVVEESPSEEVVVTVNAKQNAQDLIKKYKGLLKFVADEQAELTKGYIAKLEMAMKFM